MADSAAIWDSINGIDTPYQIHGGVCMSGDFMNESNLLEAWEALTRLDFWLDFNLCPARTTAARHRDPRRAAGGHEPGSAGRPREERAHDRGRRGSRAGRDAGRGARVYGDPEAALKLRTMLMQYDTVKKSKGTVVTVPTAMSDGFTDSAMMNGDRTTER